MSLILSDTDRMSGSIVHWVIEIGWLWSISFSYFSRFLARVTNSVG